MQHPLADRDRNIGPHSSTVGPAMTDSVEDRSDRLDFNRPPVAVKYGSDSAQCGVLGGVSRRGRLNVTRYTQHSLGGQFVHEFFEIGPEIRGVHLILGKHTIDHGVGRTVLRDQLPHLTAGTGETKIVLAGEIKHQDLSAKFAPDDIFRDLDFHRATFYRTARIADQPGAPYGTITS